MIFDRLCGLPKERKRLDTIDGAIFGRLKAGLSHPAIRKVCTLVDKQIAHADRMSKSANPLSMATYEDVDDAFRQIVE